MAALSGFCAGRDLFGAHFVSVDRDGISFKRKTRGFGERSVHFGHA